MFIKHINQFNIKIFVLILSIFLFLPYNFLIAKELPLDKSIINGTLSNGLKYTIKRNSKPAQRAEFRLFIKIGSLEEDDDQKGIAHFVEHMAFNGSKHFMHNDLNNYLESKGIEVGTHLNAKTSYENTLYKLSNIPLEDNNLETVFLVFQDWASGLNFNPIEFDKERGVILEEKRKRQNTLKIRLSNQVKKLFFKGTTFQKRSPIGTSKTIKNVNVQRAKDFYNDWYRPEFMHFIAVGDFNETLIENLIKKHFSSLKNKSKRKRASRKIIDINRTRILSITDNELTKHSLKIYFNEDLVPINTHKSLKDLLIKTMIKSLFYSKAKEFLNNGDHEAISISMRNPRLSSTRGSYRYKVEYEKNSKKALQELYEVIWSIKELGFSNKDLAFIKNKAHTTILKNREAISTLNSYEITSDILMHITRGSINYDRKKVNLLMSSIIDKISTHDLSLCFNKITSIQDQIIIIEDSSEQKLDLKNLYNIIHKAKSSYKKLANLENHKTKLLNQNLKPIKLTSKSFNKRTGIHEYILENGINIVFKQNKFKKNTLILYASSLGGSSLYEVKDLNNIKKISTFISKSGAGTFSSFELSKYLSAKGTSVKTQISYLDEKIIAIASTGNLKTMFELLFIRLTQPKIEAKVAKEQKRILNMKVRQFDKNPVKKYRKELNKFYWKNNPRRLYDTEKSIEKLNPQRMLEIYKERFSDFNNFIFIIIGDVKPESLEELIKKYIGNLPTQKRDETFIDREFGYLKNKQKFIRYYNNENTTRLRFTYRSSVPYSINNKFKADALKSILQVRLRNRLREEISANYQINVKIKLSKYLKNDSTIDIYFSCDPKRANELIQEIYSIVNRIKVNGISNNELNVFKKKYLVKNDSAMKKNTYWLKLMKEQYKDGLSLDYIFKVEDLLNQISPDNVKDMANSLFTNNVLQQELHPKVPM